MVAGRPVAMRQLFSGVQPMKQFLAAALFVVAVVVAYLFLKPQWLGCACGVPAPTAAVADAWS